MTDEKNETLAEALSRHFMRGSIEDSIRVTQAAERLEAKVEGLYDRLASLASSHQTPENRCGTRRDMIVAQMRKMDERIAALEEYRETCEQRRVNDDVFRPAPPEAKDEFLSGSAAEGEAHGQRNRETGEDAARVWATGSIAEQGGEQAGEAVPRVGRDRGGRERGAQDDGRGSVGADAPRCSQPDLAKDEERCVKHVPAAGAGAYAICNMPRDHWRHAKIGGHTFVPQEKLCGYVFEGGNACGASKAFHDQAVAYLGGGKTFQFHAFVPQERAEDR